MARFTLRERSGTGIDIPDLNTSANNVGDQVLIIDRQLEDRHGNLAGTFVFWGTIVKRFAQDDIVVAFEATNNLNKGLINTGRHPVQRLPLAKRRDLRHCRRDPQVQEGSWHGDREIRCPRRVFHLQGLLGGRLMRPLWPLADQQP